MSAMIHTFCRHHGVTPLLLEPDAWEAPVHLSDDDLQAEIGADRRARGPVFEDREEDR